MVAKVLASAIQLPSKTEMLDDMETLYRLFVERGVPVRYFFNQVGKSCTLRGHPPTILRTWSCRAPRAVSILHLALSVSLTVWVLGLHPGRRDATEPMGVQQCFGPAMWAGRAGFSGMEAHGDKHHWSQGRFLAAGQLPRPSNRRGEVCAACCH